MTQWNVCVTRFNLEEAVMKLMGEVCLHQSVYNYVQCKQETLFTLGRGARLRQSLLQLQLTSALIPL